MTAMPDAPAARTDAAVSSVIPPIATTGIPPAMRAARATASRPTGS